MDLLIRAIKEGRLKIGRDEIIVVKGDVSRSKEWAHVSNVLERLVIQLPRGVTLETVKKADAIKILEAIKEL